MTSLRRWFVRALLAALGLVVVGVGVAAIAVHELDSRALKPLVIRAASIASGLEIDYGALDLNVRSGVQLRDLVVRSPAPHRALAAELARLGALEIAWCPWPFHVRSIALSDLTVTLVQDDALGNSWEPKGPPPAAKATPPEPWAMTWDHLLTQRPPFDSLSVHGASLGWIRAHAGVAQESASVGLTAAQVDAERGRWRVRLGAPDRPDEGATLDVAYAHGTEVHEAHLRLGADVDVAPAGAHAKLALRVLDQDWDRSFALTDLARFSVAAAFDEPRQHLTVDVSEGELLSGSVRAEGQVILGTGGEAPKVSHVKAAIDSDRPAPMIARLRLPFSFSGGKLELEADDLSPSSIAPLKSLGQLHATLDVAHFSTLSGWKATALHAKVETSPQPTAARELVLRATLVEASLHRPGLALVLGHPSLRVAVPFEASIPDLVHLALDSHLGVSTGRPRPLFDEDLQIGATLSHLAVDRAAPLRSQGHAQVTLASKLFTATIEAEKHTATAELDLTAELPHLGSLSQLDPALAPFKLDWAHMPASVHSVVSLDWSGAFAALRDHTELALHAFSARTPGGTLTAQQVSLVSDSHGTRRHHHVELAIRLSKGRLDQGPVGDLAIDNFWDYDAQGPTLHTESSTAGTLAPIAALKADVGFDHARHKLTATLDAHVTAFGSLAPFFERWGNLGRVDLSSLSLSLKGSAAVAGVVKGFDAEGLPRLEPHPGETVQAEGGVDGELRGLHWFDASHTLDLEKASFVASGQADRLGESIKARLAFDHARFAVGSNEVAFEDTSLETDASHRTETGEVHLLTQGHIGHLRSNQAAGYPVANATLGLEATREADGVLRVQKLTLSNPAGGTHLELSGGLALEEQPPKLSLKGELQQDLAKVWQRADDYAGSGALTLDFAAQSADLLLFRTSAELTVRGAQLRLPRSHVVVEGLDGRVPISLDLLKGARGFEIAHGTRPNAYAALRFSDQHPLLSRTSFLSIRSLTTPQASIDSLAGNLRIEQNVVSLGQIELGVRGGRVTGQCILDFAGWDSHLHADVRASGVLSSYGEPFDGNAALSLSVRDRSVEGHAEVLRIGKRHLLDLLDLQDPDHTAPAFNRVRKALALGYPDHVRLTFEHGFANAALSFGGLARLVHIDELRGIPLEPLIDKALAASPLAEEEAP